jgi:hypothetical protein
MKNAAKNTAETPERSARSERRLKAARPVTGEYDRRGLALAMVDALGDILRHERAHKAA